MKTVVITGGSEGLGKSIAKHLASDFKVYILARSEDKLRQAAEELGCNFKVCDVANHAEVEAVVKSIIEESGSIDALVNNAGLWIEGALIDNANQHIEEVIGVNVLGVIYATKAVLPCMKKQGSGTIIQVNSQSGLYGKSERSVYHASKWAITGFTKSIQEEVAPFGIKVTGLYPAKLETQLFAKQGIDKNMSDALDTIEVAKTVKFILDSDEGTFFPEIGIKRIGT